MINHQLKCCVKVTGPWKHLKTLTFCNQKIRPGLNYKDSVGPGKGYIPTIGTFIQQCGGLNWEGEEF